MDSILKNIIDEVTFSDFSMPRISDGWNECTSLTFCKYATYEVKEGTFFDESKVIDEYALFLKNKTDDIIEQDPVEVNSLNELYNLINSTEDVYISYNDESSILTEQILINKGNTVTIDLNTNINSNGNVGGNGRIFQINDGKLVLNGNGNTITASNDSFGIFRVEDKGELNLTDTTLENSKGWGLNIKVLGGNALINDVVINSTTGGGIEVTEKELGTNSKPGIAVLNNCEFNQIGFQDHCSTCLSVSGGSKLIVNSGKYISENYCIYVFSSGGFVEINNGYFEGGKKCIIAEIDTNTYQSYSGGLQIHGGTFKGDIHIKAPAYMIIDGGSFSFDPTNYIDSNISNVTYDDTTKLYTVTKK